MVWEGRAFSSARLARKRLGLYPEGGYPALAFWSFTFRCLLLGTV